MHGKRQRINCQFFDSWTLKNKWIGHKTSRFYECRIASRFEAISKLTVNIFFKLLNQKKQGETTRRETYSTAKQTQVYRIEWYAIEFSRTGCKITFCFSVFIIFWVLCSSKPIDQSIFFVDWINEFTVTSVSCFSCNYDGLCAMIFKLRVIILRRLL